jgi:hypothetical protein
MMSNNKTKQKNKKKNPPEATYWPRAVPRHEIHATTQETGHHIDQNAKTSPSSSFLGIATHTHSPQGLLNVPDSLPRRFPFIDLVDPGLVNMLPPPHCC